MNTPSDLLVSAKTDLVLANRILANEGVLDGFGHVSARHPSDPSRFLLSRSTSPEIVEASDIQEFDLDAEPLRANGVTHYAERFIHGAIYQSRLDVTAVCHLHAAPILPFANTGTPLVPVLHVGAVIGSSVPFWDARDEFGDTDMLVSNLEQGRSLARALGPCWAAILRRHGAVVASRSVREVVFRAVHLKLNAEVQLQAQALGAVTTLSPAEIELSAEANLRPSVQDRLWNYWIARLGKGSASLAEPTVGPRSVSVAA